MLIVASTWYHKYISQFLKHLDLNIFFDKGICLSIYGGLFFHAFLNVIIRIYFFKKIVKNSPISWSQCVSTGLRTCQYGAMGIGLLVGIDYLFEANETNCALPNGEKLPKEGIFSRAISHLQDYTESKEIKANSVYNQFKHEPNVTERVLKELRND